MQEADMKATPKSRVCVCQGTWNLGPVGLREPDSRRESCTFLLPAFWASPLLEQDHGGQEPQLKLLADL